MDGKTRWIIADGFMSSTKTENYVSHEAVCVLNLTDRTAKININVFFENSEPLGVFFAECGSMRTNHIRLDKIKNEFGETIPHDVPYAILIESDTPVICQHSRMDVSQANMTLMTTMAY